MNRTGETLPISVIVPALNESRHLRACLGPVLAAGPKVATLVVDGGSGDGSATMARAMGASVLTSPVPQRAAQMNLGARVADGEVLVFLHADTVLPPGWHTVLGRALRQQPHVIGGVFRRRFSVDSAFLHLTCRLADWRARRFGWFLGDQTIFVRRNAFAAVGGYRPLLAFEDLDLSRRLKTLGPTLVLPATALSSGRRFTERGPLRQTLADLRLTLRFLRHPSAFTVARSDVSEAR